MSEPLLRIHGVFAVARPIPWDENAVYGAFGATPGVQGGDLGDLLGDLPTDAGVAVIDVSASATRGSQAGAMPGWILIPDSGNPSGVTAASSEAGQVNRPRLEIEFCD